MDRNGSAAVSRVLNPAPTTNMEPQNPPKDFLTPLGQKRRQPTARTERPVIKVVLDEHVSSVPDLWAYGKLT
jgi:hypothetical protein